MVYNTVKTEVDSGRAMLIMTGDSSSGAAGHTVLGYGYVDTNNKHVGYKDPWDGQIKTCNVGNGGSDFYYTRSNGLPSYAIGSVYNIQ